VADEEWTLRELVGRVVAALSDAEVRAPNGRVTELPDARMIRWYATIGLVDRPSGSRGRTALYGPRHLLQLVAIKRRQATGRTLAEIQFELAGATDDQLRAVAAIVGGPARADPVPPRPAPDRELHGLHLGGGAILLVPAPVGRHAEAIRSAARPLLKLLVEHGLTDDEEGDDEEGDDEEGDLA
jgi:DNA-binding transcriptional MerR regulator